MQIWVFGKSHTHAGNGATIVQKATVLANFLIDSDGCTKTETSAFDFGWKNLAAASSALRSRGIASGLGIIFAPAGIYAGCRLYLFKDN